MRLRRATAGLLVLAGASATTHTLPARAQYALAPGRLLVASADLHDPNFARTVVLLLRYGPGGAAGVVINRPLERRLSTVFPRIEPLRQRRDTLWEGGPVSRDELLLLVRSAERPDGASAVTDDVWLCRGPELLEELAIDPPQSPRRFRMYAGYAGWAPGQLDRELDAEGWHVVPGDVRAIFDEHPEGVWEQLLPPDPLQLAAADRMGGQG